MTDPLAMEPSMDLTQAPLHLRLEAAVRDPALLAARRMEPLSPALAGWMRVPEPEWKQIHRAVQRALTMGPPTFAIQEIAVFESNGDPFLRVYNTVLSLRSVPAHRLIELAEALLAMAHKLNPHPCTSVIEEAL